MKNNGNKMNQYNVNNPKIKVNLNKNSNNLNIPQVQLYQEYPEYYNTNNDKSMRQEMKNVKYHEYLEPNTYNIFTEYDSIPNYSIKQLNIYKNENIPHKDFESIYINTNGNINDDRRLFLNKKNHHQNLYKSINNKENYSSRINGKQKRITSLKGNKRINFRQNSNNDAMEHNSKSLINQKQQFQRGTKLNISKSLIEYPLNFTNNIIRNKSKYKSYNNILSEDNDINEEEEEDQSIIKIPRRQINKSKKKEIGHYNISTPNISNSNKKQLKNNKNSFAFINRRKNNENKSPKDNIDIIHIPNMKTTNSNSLNTINAFNSCCNFYQKKGDSNNRKKNEIFINMQNTNNHLEYLNTNNSVKECNQINPLYINMNNQEDIYINEIGSEYINNVETEYKINNSNNNASYYNNENYTNDNWNYIKLNPKKHMKDRKNLEIQEKLNSDNKEMQFNKSFAEINKYIKFQKNLIEKFCRNLEEYMYINIKRKFYIFIFQLRLLCKEKEQNSSILQRLHKKPIKPIKNNDYKERALSHKYIEHNPSNPFYSSVPMNNNNLNIFRKNDCTLNELSSNEYISRNTIYNNEEKKYFYNKIEKQRVNQNFYNRMGKSQDKFYTRDYNNNKYYVNDNDKKNMHDHDYRKRTKKIKERHMNSMEKYGNNLYIPKKLKKISQKPNILNNLNEKSKSKDKLNNYYNLNDYLRIVHSQKNISKTKNIEYDMNKSHDLDDEIIRAKINKDYNINSSNNVKNIQDMSFDANINNKLNINKEFENGVLKQTNNISKENSNNITPIKNEKESKKKPIYKKKIKITQAKSKIYPNKKNNEYNKNNNRKLEKVLSPNMRNIPNSNFEKIDKIKFSNSSNKKGNIENKLKNEINLINNNAEEKIKNDNQIPKIGNLIHNAKEINNIENNNDLNNNKLEKYNENGNNIEIKKTIEEFKNNEINNNNINNENMNENIDENNNDNVNNNDVNNDNNELIGSNGNNNVNDDTEESDDNIREIIVKDVSTKDRRLNVFIKYVELNQWNILKNTFNNNDFLLNLFHTDSIYFPALYPKKTNNYYSNNFYGSHNNKMKLHSILSSIIEEEEKSKAAGSVNNSIISDEENYKNGNHNSMQIVKYVTNYLQNFLDDKKKDKYFQFFKILKRIKNESFLKGLLNQKKKSML